MMARCDEGYLCEECGQPVEKIRESALYLQYVIGWIDPETLHTRRECHLQCLPSLAQFIDHPNFPKVTVEGELDLRKLDPAFAEERKRLVTRGYERLLELQRNRKGAAVVDYPLEEFIERWRST